MALISVAETYLGYINNKCFCIENVIFIIKKSDRRIMSHMNWKFYLFKNVSSSLTLQKKLIQPALPLCGVQ